MRCDNCKGEIVQMKTTIEFGNEHYDKTITFTNVPVKGCMNCSSKHMSYSFRDGLIIEHYAKHHGRNGDSIDFDDVQSAYEGMSIQNLLSFNQPFIQ